MKKKAGGRKVLGTGKFLRLLNVDGWEYIERRNSTGIVVIIAVTDDACLLLIEQLRPAVARKVIELPAGLAGDIAGQESEALTIAAERELLEETGYTAKQMEFLGEGPPSAGQSTEVVTLFLATDLKRKSAGGGDESEDITVHKVPLSKAARWLAEREASSECYVDPKVYSGLYFAHRYRKRLAARKRRQSET